MTAVFIHKTNDQVNITTGIQKMVENRVIGFRPAGHGRNKVLENVARQGELRKNKHVHPILPGLSGNGQVIFEVVLEVSEPGVDLGNGEVELHSLSVLILPQANELLHRLYTGLK